MELLFLGTGAAEAIPSFYCRCDYCNQVRSSGGKDIRSRSSFRIDAKHQIDFSPDIFYQMQINQIDTFELEHLLITHTHEDHFDLAEIIVKECAILDNEKPLNIYMSDSACRWAEQFVSNYITHLPDEVVNRLRNKYRFISLQYFQSVAAGDLNVTAVKANHFGFGEQEYAINYLIRLTNGKTMLYASDTGWYPDDTWAFLQGKSIDYLIMECTFGGRRDRGKHVEGHLDILNFEMMLEKMHKCSVIDETTPVYATHINHKHHLLHDDLQREFDRLPFNTKVAYDGLRLIDKL